MRRKLKVIKFCKRYDVDMGNLKTSRVYTASKVNIITDKVFILKRELYREGKKIKETKIRDLKKIKKLRKIKKRLGLLRYLTTRMRKREDMELIKVNVGYREKALNFKKALIYRIFRKFYNNIKVKQLKKIYLNVKKDIRKFLEKLELRLDILLVRSQMVTSIYEARQLINHEFIKVNTKIIKNYNYEVKIGDIIEIQPGIRKKRMYAKIKKARRSFAIPYHLEIYYERMLIMLIEKPKVENLNYPFTLEDGKKYFFAALMKDLVKNK